MTGPNMTGRDMTGMDMTGPDTTGPDTTGPDTTGQRPMAVPHRHSAVRHSRGLPVIHGSVGPAYEISVTPKRVPPGRYKFVVHDLNGAHNWHIHGPGVDRATSVEGSGRTVWRLELASGVYRIRCDPHAVVMHTRLTVS
jgi:hypothetical protein